jgi:5-methylcytosine-specific restriction endonuclease McrA
MKAVTPTAEEQIHFLQNLQRLLEDGQFVSTYKFALLLSLADLAVEKGDDNNERLTIDSRQIAEKFIQYYWRQAIPYPSSVGSSSILQQNTGQQAAIINETISLRETFGGSYARAIRSTENWNSLITKIGGTIRVMPLWKLQFIGGRVNDFLYENTGKGRKISLKPGIPYCLRKFHGQIHYMVRGAWVRWIRKTKANQSILGQVADLDEFLFGSDRKPLTEFNSFLQNQQAGNCFYCGKSLGNKSEVDHFIPWIRYPLDLGHNFVLAHASCNNSKRDHLADTPHLQRWVNRNRDKRTLLESYFNKNDISHDLEATERIALWAYHQAANTGSDAWIKKGSEIQPLSNDWKIILTSL